MQILRTLQTAGAGDGDVVMLDNWPRDHAADGFWLDLEMPVVLGAPGSPTTSDLKNLLDYFLGEFSIKYGMEGQYKPLIAVLGSKLRNLHRLMTHREVFNDFVGVAKLAVAQTFRARLYITPNRQKARGRKRVIGFSQGRTMEFEVKEAAALVAGALAITRGAGPFVLRIVPAWRPGAGDGFSHLPHYREINRDALDLLGPDGKTLAFWDDNAAFSATAIGKHTVKVGARSIVTLVEPKYVDENYAREIDQGGSDITDEVTLLHYADPFAPEEEIPTGPVLLELVNQDVATIKGRFVYLPSIGPGEAHKIVDEAAQIRGGDVAGTLPAPTNQPGLNGDAATAPIEFVGGTDGRFNAVPAIRSVAGQVAPFIPGQAVAAGRGLGGALARVHQKLVSLRVPGQTDTLGRGVRGPGRDAIRASFRSMF